MNMFYPFGGQDQEYDQEKVNYLFKKDIVNSINYVWNTWSILFSIKEVLVTGEGTIADKLSAGPSTDEYASNYKDYLYFHKILERISYALSDELVTNEEDIEGEKGDSSIDMYKEDIPEKTKSSLPKESDELTEDVSIFEKAYNGIKDTLSDVIGIDSGPPDKGPPDKGVEHSDKGKSNEDNTFDNLVFMVDNKEIY